MTLPAGTRLGPYEITAPLGAGGMGEVYRAMDTRLERTVAIKVLPSAFSTNTQLKVRFEREARTISQLNHPHICTLHDVGNQDGVEYLVMELLDGVTLAERVARGPLPAAELLRAGAQIAEALHAAHRVGIVHRDLKPGNIMLTRSGAKLLDFGLAKQGASGILSSSGTHAPLEGTGATMARPVTEEGSILGTFQYMAPEQLEGVDADARTDIFALGAVLYEMATGRRAFEGKTRTSLIAAIVQSQPRPISQIQPLTPPALEHVVEKCLAKDPEDRWQSAHDIAQELRWIGESEGTTTRVSSSPRSLRASILIAGALVLGSVMAGWWLSRRLAPQRPAEQVRFSITLPQEMRTSSIALAPDGRSIAYMGTDGPEQKWLLWVQKFDEEAPRKLTDLPAPSDLFWSPDGQRIAFFADDKLKAIGLDGSAPRALCGTKGAEGSWSSNGVILIEDHGSIARVSDRGGEPTVVLPASATAVYADPLFLPDGEHFLVQVAGHSEVFRSALSVGSLSGEPLRRLFEVIDSHVGYAEPGNLFYQSGDKLLARRFDPKTLRPTGDPVLVRDGIEVSSRRSFAVSRSGTIAFRTTRTEARDQIVVTDRRGRELRAVGEIAPIWHLALSPNERVLAVELADLKHATTDIWSRDLVSGILTRLTFTPQFEWQMTWSPDGATLFFASNQTDNSDIYSLPAGGGTPSLVFKDKGLQAPLDVSPDGKYVLIYENSNLDNVNVIAAPVGGGPPIPVATTPFQERSARFSPDGKWIAYDSDQSGRRELYLQSFPAPSGVLQITSTGGHHPAWRADGRELFFVTSNGHLASVPVEHVGSGMRFAPPSELFALPGPTLRGYYARYTFAPAKNGTEFFLIKEISPPIDTPIHIILNGASTLQEVARP